MDMEADMNFLMSFYEHFCLLKIEDDGEFRKDFGVPYGKKYNCYLGYGCMHCGRPSFALMCKSNVTGAYFSRYVDVELADEEIPLYYIPAEKPTMIMPVGDFGGFLSTETDQDLQSYFIRAVRKIKMS